MAIEAVGNVTSYQAVQSAAPKVSEHAAEPVKAAAKPQTAGTGRLQAVTPESAEISGFSGASAADTLAVQNEMTQEKMHKALDNINKKLSSTSCEYGYDDTTNRVTIKIIDKETEEVIRELPPEKTLEMIAKAWELAGILVDERL